MRSRTSHALGLRPTARLKQRTLTGQIVDSDEFYGDNPNPNLNRNRSHNLSRNRSHNLSRSLHHRLNPHRLRSQAKPKNKSPRRCVIWASIKTL